MSLLEATFAEDAPTYQLSMCGQLGDFLLFIILDPGRSIFRSSSGMR